MFKIMDDDNSRSLSLYEFTKAMRDFKVGIAEEYISTIFNAFDLNRDGVLDIDEFLMAIRGDLNSFRLDLVQQAFKKLDKNKLLLIYINNRVYIIIILRIIILT